MQFKVVSTLSSIAKKYNTTRQSLYEKNKEIIVAIAQSHGVRDKYYNYIYPGQKLRYKTKEDSSTRVIFFYAFLIF